MSLGERRQSWADSAVSTRRNSVTSQTSFGIPQLNIIEPPACDVHTSCLDNNDAQTMTDAHAHACHGDHDSLEKGHSHQVDIYDPKRPRLPWKQRLKHFTWAWFTLPMSTGGLSLLIYAQPHQFPGLKVIGTVVYALNLVIFFSVVAMMLARFFLHPGSMAASLTHPREGFFFPTFFLSLATIITSTQRYAVPDGDSALLWAIQAAFWTYMILAFLVAVGQYSYVFAAHSFGLQTMMPTWILPIFPIMLTGTISSVISETQPEMHAIPITVAGLTCQGLGLSVAVMMYAHMVGRLMQAGLPNREHRPGLFMCVGPPAFTALALIGMAKGLPRDLNDSGLDFAVSVANIRVMALMSAIFLWALSLWWFAIAVMAVIVSPPKYFHLGWWAMVFPNTGFILATVSISNEIHHEGATWVATGMSILLVLMYSFVFYNHVRAVIVQDIMYPGRDEDVNDH